MALLFVAAALRRFQKENGDIPYLSVSYEGLKETNTHTRLEAFMHQARGYFEKGEGQRVNN